MDSFVYSASRGMVRRAGPGDAAVLAAIYRPYVEHTAVSFEYEAPDAAEFEDRIRRTMEQYPFLVYQADDGQVLGYAYASRFQSRRAYDWSAETSVYVRQDVRGKGVGRSLYEELENLLRRQGVRNMYACIASPREDNTNLSDASIRFHAAMGFRLAGNFCRCGNKFSQWYDMCWMEKTIGTYEADPAPFIPFSELEQRGRSE